MSIVDGVNRPSYHLPDMLLSGDHARIAAWRDEQSRQRTAQRRPDLPPAAT